MKLSVLPLFWNVDILGVEIGGNGTDPTAASDVSVIVEGVCTLVASVGEGGKTKSVCDGVWAISIDLLEATEVADGRRRTLCRRRRGGGAGLDDSTRLRMLRGRIGGRLAFKDLGTDAGSGSESCSMTIGLDGTAGSTEIDIDSGRRLALVTGGRSNELRTAVAGGGGSAVKLVRHAGAEGGGAGANRAVWGVANGGIPSASSSSSSGELDAEDSVVWPETCRSESNPPPTPRRCSSSSSSTRSSLMTLLEVP